MYLTGAHCVCFRQQLCTGQRSGRRLPDSLLFRWLLRAQWIPSSAGTYVRATMYEYVYDTTYEYTYDMMYTHVIDATDRFRGSSRKPTAANMSFCNYSVMMFFLI